MNSNDKVKIQLLFVDEGSYHHEEVWVAGEVLGKYERLIDCLREEPEVLRDLYVDVNRLCAAHRVVEES
ncbi:MAG: hypothetical protein WDZ89_00875 [Gemmatimonadota bacterium]